jgi:hypothetical protein
LSEKNSGQEHAKDGEATRFLEASAHMIASGLRLLRAAQRIALKLRRAEEGFIP